ncbi:replication initiator protein [Dipodfec virus RodF1_50]|uniref:Replication initiator protein n=1 Tax=Dipodfec virus RodF1_50 TaxID=2929300 RepID=A0A976N343_9VIRU|nr:replication initiator protein [Dipodfec virus RodF1_50]
MSCFHPLKRWFILKTPDGKELAKVTSYDVEQMVLTDWKRDASSLDDVTLFMSRDTQPMAIKGLRLHPTEIPCGKCSGCRMDYARSWADRCMLELEYHSSAYFVTLTYNDEHLPLSGFTDEDTGEFLPAATLLKRDFQLFMKRLRKRFGEGIRFFAAGEYGTTTFRPHYHAILFGIKLDDLALWRRAIDSGIQDDFTYRTSPTLEKIWGNGFVCVADVTWETCAYTARYVMKKLKGPAAQFYDMFNIEPPFTLMSRQPGIAKQYYLDHPDCMEYDFINISTPNGGKKIRPPKYYRDLYEVDFPIQSQALRITRKKMAEQRQKLRIDQTGLSYLEMLAVQEHSLDERIKALKRGYDDGKP